MVLLDLNADGVASVAKDLGDTVVGVAGNVAQEDDVAGAVALAVERFGQLDVAFNIAGIARIGAISSSSTAPPGSGCDAGLCAAALAMADAAGRTLCAS